jgi:BASS family bile acid:Na+ symporter
MPPFAVAAALAFDLHPAVKIALVAVAVSPVPPFLPLKATKAGGARNYTIGLLVAASALAVVLVPLAVELVGAVFGKPFAMPVTGSGDRDPLGARALGRRHGSAPVRAIDCRANRTPRCDGVRCIARPRTGGGPAQRLAPDPFIGSGTVLAFAAFVAI